MKALVTGVYADDWETLSRWIQMAPILFGGRREAPALTVTMPCCGEKRVWRYAHQVPVNDVGRCACGNWFIRYREQYLKVEI